MTAADMLMANTINTDPVCANGCSPSEKTISIVENSIVQTWNAINGGWFDLYVGHIDRHGDIPNDEQSAIYEEWAAGEEPAFEVHKQVPISWEDVPF